MMKINIKGKNENIAVIESESVLILDAASALDLAMDISQQSGSHCFALQKSHICEDFWKLSTGIAGEILQKYINYGFKIAIYGDFSVYTSKPLNDFIRESNRGKDFFFVATQNEAIEKLESVT